MNLGPRKIVIIIAAHAGDEDLAAVDQVCRLEGGLDHSPRTPISSSVKCSRPTEREPLTRSASPCREQVVGDRDRRRRVGRPLIGRVVASKVADADHRPDAKAAGVRTDIAVEGRRIRPQLGHPAEDRQAPASEPGISARLVSAARIEIGLAL